jgi:TatD DNase family protein
VRGLIDTHTHLQLEEFGRDREAVLERAWQAGVEGIVVLGLDAASSEAAIAVAGADPRLYATVGWHPNAAARLDQEGWRRLRELTQHPRVVAVGEIGLDFYRNLSPREDQVRVLEEQLALAAERRLPVAVHCRDAHEQMYPILKRWAEKAHPLFGEGRPLGVMHYFSGDPELARRYVDMGFLISVHTCVTYPTSDRLREVVAGLDMDCLVLETDSPYGAPQSQRGRRNEPAYVAEAAMCVAELRSLTAEAVALRSGENAARLFGLRPAQAGASSAGGRAW